MLYQLKNLQNWSAMPLDPGDNMKAAEDFLQVVLQGNIAAAAETICTASSRKPLLKICNHHQAPKLRIPMTRCFCIPQKLRL